MGKLIPIIAIPANKGGQGKSSAARELAVQLAKAGWKVLIGDLNLTQPTAANWVRARKAAGLPGVIDCQSNDHIPRLVQVAEASYNVLILDCPPGGGPLVNRAIKEATAIVLSTGTSSDDLEPTVALYENLVDKGRDPKSIVTVIQRAQTTAQYYLAKRYLSPCKPIDGCILAGAGYIAALDAGKGLSETAHASRNKQAAKVFGRVIDAILAAP